ncbi:MAG: hypothetical protein GXP27_02220 [Planctomycetes bacterium]|nr:hypothetical protein [Planctomycetota bacterium]
MLAQHRTVLEYEMERQYIFFRRGLALAALGLGATFTFAALCAAWSLWPQRRWFHVLIITLGTIASCWIAARLDRRPGQRRWRNGSDSRELPQK